MKGELPEVYLDTDLQQKGCCTYPERPSWELGSLLLQLSECQGQGTDARPGHPGMSGKAPWTASVDRNGECLTFWMQKHLSGCQVPASQGWGSEANFAEAAPGCRGSALWEMASTEVIHGTWNPMPSGCHLSFQEACLHFILLTSVLNLATGLHVPKLAWM